MHGAHLHGVQCTRAHTPSDVSAERRPTAASAHHTPNLEPCPVQVSGLSRALCSYARSHASDIASVGAKASNCGTIGQVRSCHSPHTWALCACLLKHCSELPHHAQLDSPKQAEHVRCAGHAAAGFFFASLASFACFASSAARAPAPFRVNRRCELFGSCQRHRHVLRSSIAKNRQFDGVSGCVGSNGHDEFRRLGDDVAIDSSNDVTV